MKLTSDQIEQIKQAYLDGNYTLEELSAESSALFGVRVTHDTMQRLAVQGRWPTLKRRKLLGKEGLPRSPEEAMNDMAQIVFDAIMDAENPVSSRDLSSLINAYTNLTQRLPQGDASQKTSRQQVLDMIKEVKSNAARPD